MARRHNLTDKQIGALPRKAKRYVLPDPEQRGLYLRVPPAGPITFTAVARGPYSKQIWTTLGTTADLKIDAARSLAQQTIRRIKEGKPAIEPPKPQPDSVAVIAERWLTRHVEKNKHRRGAESRRIIEKYVLPYWGERAFTDLKRGDITLLLDHIEDKHGAGTADRTLITLRAIASWHQARDDAYVPPFVRGMSRSPKAARARILSDAELRAVWKAAESSGQFGAIVRLLLLSAQRREKVHSLRWDDVDGDVWTIRTAEREKGNPGKLKLPPIALDIIRAQPRFAGNPYVFAGQHGPAWHILSGRPKRNFDAKCGVTGWRLHDLRRTARSLMSRAGVQSEHAERVLGHVIGGVEGIYNRHTYDVEKADALLKLAALIEQIAHPGRRVVPVDNGDSLPKVYPEAKNAVTG